MSLLSIPVRRPVATAMFYLAVVLLGVIAWQRIPVELFPEMSGDTLSVGFARPGSEPEVVEREILIPLEGRVQELAGVAETWGRVNGSSGSFGVRFEPGVDLKVAALELQRIAAELERAQPPGSFVESSFGQDMSLLSKFVMVVQITGDLDRGPLHEIVAQRIQPRLKAVSGVRDVMIFGGAREGIEVRIDPDRAAALGVSPGQITSALRRVLGPPSSAGSVQGEAGRRLVVVEAAADGPVEIAQTRIDPRRPVQIRHVAEVERTHGEEREVFRVDGKRAVGAVIFKQSQANLVQLGRELRDRIADIEDEMAPLGIRVSVVSDGAEIVEDQIERLEKLAGSGYLIALVVLFLFLRRWRAVLVVAITAPVSLLGALALLYLFGRTFNMLSLFGLAVGLGMLIDNAIVVFEAVQRRLERRVSPDEAATEGAARTVRAIFAGTLTNAVVFFPLLLIDIESTMMRGVLEELALAYLLPLAASLLVAVGLVPLLARRLAAPAAVERLREEAVRRDLQGGLRPPQLGRELFGGVVRTALVHPGPWLTGVFLAVAGTAVVATIWFGVSSIGGNEAPEASEVQIAVRVEKEVTLDQTVEIVSRLEQAVLDMHGVEQVSSMVQESTASLTVTMVDRDERPADVNAATVRSRLNTLVEKELEGVTLARPGEADGSGGGGGGGPEEMFGQGPLEVRVSHPDRERLWQLATEIRSRLASIEEIGSNASIGHRRGMDELWVMPREGVLEGLALTPDQIFPALGVVRREGVVMQSSLTLDDGRELPVTVLREDEIESRAELSRTRLATPSGVVPLYSVADLREELARPPIVHRDGRRELTVSYRFGYQAPESGPARAALERNVSQAIASIHRPPGATVETPQADEETSWFRKAFVPIVLSLFVVLAVTFESLVLPVLVLVALPLTLIGATWALVLAGMPLGPMALVGAMALIGLTVNPAILLVDRMQQLARAGWPAGGSALAAVRERARPVLMTALTTIAGLWPLALETGQENEIWPPFATIVMGGLGASAVLTLLVLPVGYVLLRRLDNLFGRLGAWVVLIWLLLTAACVTPLFVGEVINSLTWQIVVTVLVGAFWLGAIALAWKRAPAPEPEGAEDAAPPIEIRTLDKVYGQPGPIRTALRAKGAFAQRVLERGGKPFLAVTARERLVSLALLLAGALYLAWFVEATLWVTLWTMVAAALAAQLALEFRRARGRTDELGRVDPGGPEGVLAAAAPWIGWFVLLVWGSWIPRLEGTITRGWTAPVIWLGLLAIIILVVQRGRATALAVGRGERPVTATDRLRRTRTTLSLIHI